MIAIAASAILGLLIAVSVERQLPFRGGRLVALGIAAVIATAASGILIGGLGLPAFLGALAGAAVGIGLSMRLR